jgi:hypothetical protein
MAVFQSIGWVFLRKNPEKEFQKGNKRKRKRKLTDFLYHSK